MAKQLFNSSEKSNFILNMSEESYSKIASVGLLTSFFSTSVLMAIPTFAKSNLFTISALGLAIAGVFCMVTALIAAIKKFIGKRELMPLIGAGAFLVCTLISLLLSYDKMIGIYGYSGRGEGFMAMLFYVCIFITGMSIKTESSLKVLMTGLVGTGLLNSVIALIQVFSGNFNSYKYISLEINANAASGLAQSPIFLAMLLTLSLTAALIGFAAASDMKKKLFCLVSAAIFSFVMMFTYSLMGIVGEVIGVLSAVIAVFALKAPKVRLLSVLAVIAPAAAAFFIVQSGAIGNLSEYRLYDGRILWHADSYMRISASGMPSDNLDLDNTSDVYYMLNRKAMDIISGAPLTGTGPDQLIFPQLYTYGPVGDEESAIEDIIIHNKGTIDRVYNEYLNAAATKGIPAAAAMCIMILSAVIMGRKGFRLRRSPESLCMVMTAVWGAVIFLVSCSNTAFSPIFWAICGCACADIPKKAAAVSEKSDKKN